MGVSAVKTMAEASRVDFMVIEEVVLGLEEHSKDADKRRLDETSVNW